jgi:F0F1-type ATP synthase assembly protein I
MSQPSTASLSLRAGLVLLTSASMVCAGAVLDKLAGTSPFGLLIFLASASIFGTVMIYVVIASSFPKEQAGAPQAGDRKPGDE